MAKRLVQLGAVPVVDSPAAVACAELRRGAERAWSLRAYTSPRAC